jgi:hypothetical protein
MNKINQAVNIYNGKQLASIFSLFNDMDCLVNPCSRSLWKENMKELAEEYSEDGVLDQNRFLYEIFWPAVVEEAHSLCVEFNIENMFWAAYFYSYSNVNYDKMAEEIKKYIKDYDAQDLMEFFAIIAK